MSEQRCDRCQTAAGTFTLVAEHRLCENCHRAWDEMAQQAGGAMSEHPDYSLDPPLTHQFRCLQSERDRLQAENAELVRQRNLAEETLTRVETERLALARRVQDLEDTVRDLLGKPVLR